MKPDLIIITRQFPYGNNETFLESEIPILSDYFSTITIYPSTKTESKRPLPLNVIVNDLICNDYINKKKWGLKTILSLFFLKNIFHNANLILNRRKITALIKYLVSYTIYKNKIKIILSTNLSVLIYSYWYNPFVDAFCDLNIANRKIITRVHRGDLYEEFSELGFFPERNLRISKIDKIFSISEHGVHYLKKKFDINNISVSKLGVVDKCLIAKYSSNQSYSIASVSNIIPIKNVQLIAKSIKKFASENQTIEIFWNHFGDGPEMIEVKNIAFDDSIKNLKCVFHGRVNNDKVLEFYSKTPTDLFINLSSSEGIPVSIMEAISFGIPIIATDVGGVSEIVNEKTGVLLKNELDEVVIASYIKKMYDCPKDREAVKNYWLNNYSAQNNYLKFAKDLIQQY